MSTIHGPMVRLIMVRLILTVAYMKQASSSKTLAAASAPANPGSPLDRGLYSLGLEA